MSAVSVTTLNYQHICSMCRALKLGKLILAAVLSDRHGFILWILEKLLL